jgi:hypothetical protein
VKRLEHHRISLGEYLLRELVSHLLFRLTASAYSYLEARVVKKILKAKENKKIREKGEKDFIV